MKDSQNLSNGQVGPECAPEVRELTPEEIAQVSGGNDRAVRIHDHGHKHLRKVERAVPALTVR